MPNANANANSNTNANTDIIPPEYLVIDGPLRGARVRFFTGTISMYEVVDGDRKGEWVSIRPGWVRAIVGVGGVAGGRGTAAGLGGEDDGSKGIDSRG